VDSLEVIQEELKKLSPDQRASIDAILDDELHRRWHPTPGPQLQAYLSPANVILYGGAAGGGKSDLLLGLAVEEHQRSLIIRRQTVDLRGLEDRLFEITGTEKGYNSLKKRYREEDILIEFGGLKDETSHRDYQGRPHDLLAFDEVTQLREFQVRFLMGWVRSATDKPGEKGRRTRIVMASNPPIGGDGLWIIQWFAPWLDPLHPKPAKPGELRWCVFVGNEIVWVGGPEPVNIAGEAYIPRSFTFIPAKLDDNPYLRDTNYRAEIMAMPEPLRSQLLYGDFSLSKEDAQFQIIPSEWVRLAQDRWEKNRPKEFTMTGMGFDPSGGGQDSATIAKIYGTWFDEIESKKGANLNDSRELAAFVIENLSNSAPLAIDCTGGYGIGPRDHLRNNGIKARSVVFSKKSTKKPSGMRSADSKLKFGNIRMEMWWKFREALDPKSGNEISLPPDNRLAAELCTPVWKVRGNNMYTESKDDLRRRLGSSTDRADCVIMAWKVNDQGHRLKSWAADQNSAPLENPHRGL